LWKANLVDDPHHLPSRLAYAHYLEAATRWQDAVDQFELALADAPEMVPVRCDLAAALLAVHRPQDALAVLQPAIAARPGDPAVLEQFGDTLVSLGNRTVALEDYRKAAERAVPASRRRLKLKIDALRSSAPGGANGGTAGR
jgi:predicted Zn-dependent protease